MKKYIILLMLICYTFHAHADKNMELSFAPYTRLSSMHHELIRGFGAPSMALNYRVKVSDSSAFGLGAVGRALPGLPWDIGVEFSWKYFPTRNVFEDGWFIQPSLSVIMSPSASYREHDSEGNLIYIKKFRWSITPSFIGGYTWVWASGFLINLGAGLGYGFHFSGKERLIDNGSHLTLATDISLGWAF